MSHLKDLFYKNRKFFIIIIVVLFIITIGYFSYQNNQKQKILKSMSITFTDVTEIEYGTKDLDVNKELVKKVQNAKIKNLLKIDTMKPGKQNLKFTLINDGLEKEIQYKIHIKDTNAPEIIIKEDVIELTVGDEFDISSNIESVKDIIDGDIPENNKASEINVKATSEYKKLKNKNIKKETKIAGELLNDFMIEDMKDQDVKNLYLKNCYYVDGTVDTEKADEYTIKVIAVDKNGLKTEKEFKVVIKEKELVQPLNNNEAIDNNNGNSNHSSSSNSEFQNNTKQGISSVVNSALGQVGTPYVYGGSAPGGFDCSGLIYWAFNSNGYSIPRAVASAGYSIGNNILNAEYGDILVLDGHFMIYMGGNECVQSASNAGGVIHSHNDKSINYARLICSGDPNATGANPIIDIRRVR